MSVYRLELHGYLPPSANEILRTRSWQKKHRLKKNAERLIWVYNRKAGQKAIPKAQGRRSVEIILDKGPRGKTDDPDNLYGRCKFLLDGLVNQGLLLDDSRQYLDLEVRDYAPTTEKRTTITIRDL